MTLELLDGSLVSPLSVFDALDTVEEYCGTELRQYLESYFIDGEEPVTRDEHLIDVLEGLDAITLDLERELTRKQLRRKEIQYSLDRLRATIQREMGDK